MIQLTQEEYDELMFIKALCKRLVEIEKNIHWKIKFLENANPDKFVSEQQIREALQILRGVLSRTWAIYDAREELLK